MTQSFIYGGPNVTYTDTIATLQTVKPYQDGQVIIVTGENFVGDASGANYVWVDSSTATPDGVNVISSSYSTSTGRWLIIQKDLAYTNLDVTGKTSLDNGAITTNGSGILTVTDLICTGNAQLNPGSVLTVDNLVANTSNGINVQTAMGIKEALGLNGSFYITSTLDTSAPTNLTQVWSNNGLLALGNQSSLTPFFKNDGTEGVNATTYSTPNSVFSVDNLGNVVANKMTVNSAVVADFISVDSGKIASDGKGNLQMTGNVTMLGNSVITLGADLTTPLTLTYNTNGTLTLSTGLSTPEVTTSNLNVDTIGVDTASAVTVAHNFTVNGITTLNSDIVMDGNFQIYNTNGFLFGSNTAKGTWFSYDTTNYRITCKGDYSVTGTTTLNNLSVTGNLSTIGSNVAGNCEIEFGPVNNSSTGLTFIDWHTGYNNDFDVRTVVSGGTKGTNGTGTYNLMAGNFQINGKTGWTGTYTADGKTVTVTNGIITNVA